MYREHRDCEGCEDSSENKLFVPTLFIQLFEELCYFKIKKMERCSYEIKHTSQCQVSAHFEVAEAVQTWWWWSDLVDIQTRRLGRWVSWDLCISLTTGSGVWLHAESRSLEINLCNPQLKGLFTDIVVSALSKCLE